MKNQRTHDDRQKESSSLVSLYRFNSIDISLGFCDGLSAFSVILFDD